MTVDIQRIRISVVAPSCELPSRRSSRYSISAQRHAVRYPAGRRRGVTGGFAVETLEELRVQPEVASIVARIRDSLISLRGDSPVATLVKLLVDSGCQIEEERKGAANLEVAFLSVMERES